MSKTKNKRKATKRAKVKQSTRCIKKSVKRATLVKSKKRVRDVGEVFTPAFLVERMLDEFPEDAWAKNRFWLEPTCGNGNFVIAILKRKIALGFTMLEALDTTYGMDIMEDNITECHIRIYRDVIIPWLVEHKPTGKTLINIRAMAICMVINNFQVTKDALLDDWQNKFIRFSDRTEKAKQNAIAMINRKLDMVMGIIPVENKNNVLYNELLVFSSESKTL